MNREYGLIGIVMTVVVGIILVGSLLAPVISGVTDHSKTFSNVDESLAGVWTLADDTPVTFEYDSTNKIYTVNDVQIQPFSANYSTVTSDGMVIRWSGGNPSVFVPSESKGYSGGDFSITASNGTITATLPDSGEPTEVTTTYTYLYYQSADGDYVMTNGTNPIYLMGDSEIHCTGYNTSLGSGAARWFFATGNIDDGFSLTYGTTTVTDYTLNATELSGYEEDVYEVTSIVFHISESLDVTVNRLVAPGEITVTKESDQSIDNLYLVIPLLIIVGLLLVVVRFFTGKND